MDVERARMLLREVAEKIKLDTMKLAPAETSWRKDLAEAAIETTSSSNDAAILLQEWLRQLREGEEIALEGNFLETREPNLNKPVEKFAFRKGISNE